MTADGLTVDAARGKRQRRCIEHQGQEQHQTQQQAGYIHGLMIADARRARRRCLLSSCMTFIGALPCLPASPLLPSCCPRC